MQNHFELFQLPLQFEIDLNQLDSAYREIQGRVHPDRFVAASEAEKRVAMQWATRANEAYQTLKQPQRRAEYLCELHGVALQAESNTAMPAAFLMQQMEWREALEDARRARQIEALDDLQEELQLSRQSLMQQVQRDLQEANYMRASASLRSLMFVDKFAEELELAFDMLDA